MAKFFDPPQAKPLLPKEKIDKVYKSMRFKVFMGSFLGYAAYYLVRKNLSLAAPGMIEDGLVDKASVSQCLRYPSRMHSANSSWEACQTALTPGNSLL